MARKKSGSTLIITIIVFAVVFTVGMAFLSMSISGYKLTQSQNKRIENLYGADSGLDVAYDILVKNFGTAVQFGSFNAKQLEFETEVSTSVYKSKYIQDKQDLADLDKDDEKTPEQKSKIRKEITNDMEGLVNKEFRRSFKYFLYATDDEKNELGSEGIHIDITNQLKCSLENKDLVNNNARDYLDGIKPETQLTKTIESDDFNSNSVKLVSNGGESEPEINLDQNSTYPVIDDENSMQYKIILNSTFKTAEGNTNVTGEHQRTVQATYTIDVPQYTDVDYGELEVNNTSYKDKGLTIGGNMDVTDGNVTVDGNIFVQGNQNEAGTALQNKYTGGISLKNVNAVNFNGNVVTGENFNVGDSVKNATINKNLYAGNVYAGDKDNLDNCIDDANLNVSGDMVLNNDLTLKAIHSSITTNNFYGINSDTLESSTTSNLNKVKNSSSIIVNKYKDGDADQTPSKIEITNEALIMGVAYINTGNEQGYATGESVGVKGNHNANYNAYSEHVPSDNEGDNNLQFDIDEDHDAQSPLYLVGGTVVQKDQHFYDYWNEKPGQVDSGGIHFDNPNNVFSTGAIVYKDNSSNVEKAKGPMESLKSKSSTKQEEFASRVYDMDMDSDIDKITNQENIEYLSNLYKSSTGRKTVDNLMDFTGDRFKDEKPIQIGDINGEFALFNPKEDRDIEIKEYSSPQSEVNITGLDTTDGTITISVPTGKTLNMFLATAGNVTVEGKVTINGNIIAKGNLTVKGSGDKTITYDSDLASKLQLIDYDIFKEVFGEGSESTDTQNTQTNVVVQYDLSEFLKNKLWKLIN